MQGVLVGPVVKRFGDRRVMITGLCFGAVGIACMGLAPTGLMFTLAMLPNALWGLAMPTIQSLMTQHVSESEQGQLQGANNSVGADRRRAVAAVLRRGLRCLGRARMRGSRIRAPRS